MAIMEDVEQFPSKSSPVLGSVRVCRIHLAQIGHTFKLKEESRTYFTIPENSCL